MALTAIINVLLRRFWTERLTTGRRSTLGVFVYLGPRYTTYKYNCIPRVT